MQCFSKHDSFSQLGAFSVNTSLVHCTVSFDFKAYE